MRKAFLTIIIFFNFLHITKSFNDTNLFLNKTSKNLALRSLTPLTIPFTINSKYKTPYIINYLGLNDQVEQVIDITANTTWSSIIQLKWNYISKADEVYSQNRIQAFSLFGLYYNASFTLGDSSNDITIPSFNWFLYDHSLGKGIHRGGLGLARTFPTEEEDIITQLYKEKKIESQMFSISFRHQNEGYLLVGDLAEGLVEYPEYNSFINLVEIDEKWRANLTHIFFGNISNEIKPNVDPARNEYIIRKDIYDINYPAYFSTVDKYIIVPHYFILYLQKNYFNNFPYCSLEKDKELNKFTCNLRYKSELLQKIKTVNFVFDSNTAFCLGANMLFEEENDKLIFVIVSYDKFEEWVLGYYFMRNYFITFIRTSPFISIYSFLHKYYVIIKKDDSSNGSKIISYISISGILIISIILLLYIKLQNKIIIN